MADGADHRTRDLIPVLADQFGLSPEERKELLPSGRQARFDNRVHWAAIHLKEARLVETSGRGAQAIAARGLEVLSENPERLSIRALERFPEYRARVPELETLTRVLGSVFEADGAVTILEREPNAYVSTFPSELVTCRPAEGDEIVVFCKYGAPHEDNAFGHKGAVWYEAQVYRQILAQVNLSAPNFYGFHRGPVTDQSWLFTEYIDGGERVDKMSDYATGMGLAARWIGQFHTVTESLAGEGSTPLLTRYGEDYYRGWVNRASSFAGDRHKRFPWLATLCERYEGFLGPLLSARQTVIHGEYYPRNVLLKDGLVYPVDWEAAAVAPGEIDLASLTECWAPEIAQHSAQKYVQARWAGRAPDEFQRTMDAARIYWHFRWLGDRPARTVHPDLLPRFEQLRAASERLGLI
jgi:thiamine kinase-like enzyme